MMVGFGWLLSNEGLVYGAPIATAFASLFRSDHSCVALSNLEMELCMTSVPSTAYHFHNTWPTCSLKPPNRHLNVWQPYHRDQTTVGRQCIAVHHVRACCPFACMSSVKLHSLSCSHGNAMVAYIYKVD